MRHPRRSLVLLCAAATLLVACALPEPQPIPEGVQVAEPSQQKCATVTGSRIATTCSNMVKSSTNKSAMQEMQRHRSLNGNGDNGWGSPIGR